MYDKFKWVRLSITPEDASPFYPEQRFDKQRIPQNLIENSKNIENVYVELYSYNYIDCQNNRKVCPICKGTSVMIIETDVSKIYKTCPFSDNKGFLTCDEYNLFLRGKLKPKTSN